MGQALYRKYRSKSLDQIIGQDHITQSLKHALEEGNISHAYLFSGPRGVGKTSIARILAYEVNNIPYAEDAAQQLDIIEIDAASHRGIDDIRELRDKVNITPTSLKYKVYIIDEVHMLSKDAFNALLKTLEEPPAHVIFILATTELQKVPETIISRTQRFSFKPVPKDKVVSHLKEIAKLEKINIDDQALEMIADHGNGSFRDSISLLDQVRNQSGKVTLDNVLDTIGLAPVQVIDSIKEALEASDKLQLLRVLSDIDNNGYDPAIIANQLAVSVRRDVFSGQSVILEDRALNLLSGLISVKASTNPGLSLELTLINVLSEESQETPLPKSEKPKPAIPKAITLEENPEITNQQTEEKDESEKNPLINEIAENPIEYNQDEAWHSVLDIIKKTHNTLYSILRMARPTWDEEKITIAFQFPFHQKKLTETANNEVISSAIKEVIHKKLKVECVVDSSIKPIETIEVIPDESPIENISNIFGSVELLES